MCNISWEELTLVHNRFMCKAESTSVYSKIGNIKLKGTAQ